MQYRRSVGSRLRLINTTLLLASETTALVVLIGLGDRPPFDLAVPVSRSSLDAWREATPEAALSAALRWVALVAGHLAAVRHGRVRARSPHRS